MYITITDTDGIEIYKNFAQVKKHTSFKPEDFTKIGTDFILNCTDETFEIVKDIKLLENVAAQKMFTKNKFDTTDILVLITLLLSFFNLVN